MKRLYIRKGKTIFNLEDTSQESFQFVNEAKRKSHKLQMQNGGLGRGSLSVE